MGDLKLFFIDIETGGVRPTDPILQLSWIIKTKDTEYSNNYFIKANIEDCDPVALAITGIDPSDPYAIEPEYACKLLIQDLSQHLDERNRHDKFYLVGYNCQNFDSKFIRRLFVENNFNYNKFFWNPSIDVMLIAAGFCVGQRQKLGDFKLPTVAKALGLIVDEDSLHDSMYDVLLTKDIYDVLAKEMLA